MAAKSTAAREEHETGLRAFVLPRRRVRFRESLDDTRRRRKLLNELSHFEHQLDPRFVTLQEQHTKHAGHVDEVYARLIEKGAPPTCFVVATTAFDGEEAPLRDAVEDLMRVGAGLISCIPGRLGLYVSDNGSNVFVLERKP